MEEPITRGEIAAVRDGVVASVDRLTVRVEEIHAETNRWRKEIREDLAAVQHTAGKAEYAATNAANQAMEASLHSQKTNGRVTLLEAWQNRLMGAISVLTFLCGAGAVWIVMGR